MTCITSKISIGRNSACHEGFVLWTVGDNSISWPGHCRAISSLSLSVSPNSSADDENPLHNTLFQKYSSISPGRVVEKFIFHRPPELVLSSFLRSNQSVLRPNSNSMIRRGYIWKSWTCAAKSRNWRQLSLISEPKSTFCAPTCIECTKRSRNTVTCHNCHLIEASKFRMRWWARPPSPLWCSLFLVCSSGRQEF